MKKYVGGVLVALVCAVALGSAPALAQGSETRVRAEVTDMPVVIGQVDPVLREVIINGHRFRMPAGVPVRYPQGEVLYGPDSLEPGMQVRMDGVLPASAQDIGEIRGVTVVPH